MGILSLNFKNFSMILILISSLNKGDHIVDTHYLMIKNNIKDIHRFKEINYHHT